MPRQSTKAKVDSASLEAVHEALDRVQAIAEFSLDGTVLRANENFLALQQELADALNRRGQ